ncbi:MAG: hypothetical protein Q4D71_12010, partial [Oscillospiraceae bacterium]|nr:hypothetical protein [Oscillospiraceae bacterium]
KWTAIPNGITAHSVVLITHHYTHKLYAYPFPTPNDLLSVVYLVFFDRVMNWLLKNKKLINRCAGQSISVVSPPS